MTPPHPAAQREVAASRCAAVLGGAAAALHVPLALAHAGTSLVLAGALFLMALACLPCSGHLWRCPGPRAWSLVAALGAAMVLAHVVLLRLPPPAATDLPAASALPAATLHGNHAAALPAAVHGDVALAPLAAGTALQVLTCTVLLLRRADGPRRWAAGAAGRVSGRTAARGAPCAARPGPAGAP